VFFFSLIIFAFLYYLAMVGTMMMISILFLHKYDEMESLMEFGAYVKLYFSLFPALLL